MANPTSSNDLLIEKLRTHLKAEGYSDRVQQWYPARARRFLAYCAARKLAIEGVRSMHVMQFLRRQYRLFRRRHGEPPPFLQWHHRYTGAIHMLLRLVHGRWPVPDPPATALEAFHRELVAEYDAWLRDLRGLQAETRTKRRTHALRFLMSLGSGADQEGLAGLTVRDVDGYLKQSCTGLRRHRSRTTPFAYVTSCGICIAVDESLWISALR